MDDVSPTGQDIASGVAAYAPPTVTIRRMTVRDTAAAARLHASELPHGFFPRLGRLFLAEYYRAFVSSPYAVALAADDGQHLRGFLVGVVDSQHYRWALRNRGRRLAAAAVLSLAMRPWLLKPLLAGRLRRYTRALIKFGRRRPTPGASPAATHARAVLAHVAVDESLRGLRIGTRLAEEFLSAAREAGLDSARTTTLEGGAVEFYRRNGWHVETRATDWDGNGIVVLTRPTSRTHSTRAAATP